MGVARSNVILFLVVWISTAGRLARAASFELSYTARLVDPMGAPFTGPIEATVRFYGSEDRDDQLGDSLRYRDVELVEGVMQLTIRLNEAQQMAIFGDGTRRIYVEVEAGGRVYPRQSYAMVPFALRVPVDNDQLIFAPDTSKLTIDHIEISQVNGLASALSHSTQAASGSSAGYLSQIDWLRFDGKQPLITPTSEIAAGTLATQGQAGVWLKPYGADPDETGELRFGARSTPNYVGLKAPDSIATNQIWTLPDSDGAPGQALTTNGTGSLQWQTLGAGDLATRDAVSGGLNGTIEDGSISDIDIASNAAITDSKLASITSVGKVSGNAINAGTIAGTATFLGSGGIVTSGIIRGSKDIVLEANAIGPSTLRFADHDGSNYVGFKAPGTLISDQIWTLPSADGATGSILKTDGNGNLSWVPPGGGGDLFAASNLSDLADKDAARSNLGLGALATRSNVSGTEMVDGSLFNSDISASAQIATSKLSGSVLDVQSHGLGSLAALSSINANEINTGAISNSHVALSAAIDTSKLSGPILAIAGHGLGTLATMNSIAGDRIEPQTILDANIADTAAISGSKISFADDSVSGSKIHGGVISEFASTGIDDNATSVALTLHSSGNVGIGTASPAAALDINGQIKIQGGSPGPGKVLTSDASGLASWLSPATSGTVSSVGITAPASGITVTGGPITSSGSMTLVLANDLLAVEDLNTTGLAVRTASDTWTTTANNSADWDTAFNERLQWDGGATGLVAATGRTSLELGTLATKSSIANADIGASAAIDASKIADGTVSTAEFQYLGNVTSDVQSQLNTKANAENPTFTGVMSAALGSAAAPSYTFTGDTNTGVWSATADTLSMGTGGSERLTIAAGGNVGIGTTAPANTLSVAGSANFTGNVGIGTTNPGSLLSVYSSAANPGALLSVRGNMAGSYPGLISVTDDSPLAAGTGGGIQFVGVSTAGGNTASAASIRAVKENPTDGDYAFGLALSTRAYPSTSYRERVRITADGNVGIGTTAPIAPLHVNGNLLVESENGRTWGINGLNSGQTVYFQYGGDNENRIETTYGSNATLRSYWGLSVANKAGEVARLGTTYTSLNSYFNGNVGIGTTSPSSALTVAGAARNAAASLNTTTTIDFASSNLQYTNANCGSFTLHNLKDGGSYSFVIKGSTAATCGFTAFSDAGTTALTLHMPSDHGATTSNKHTMYVFLVVGSDAYVSWTPGL